jgi:hypothetical protein
LEFFFNVHAPIDHTDHSNFIHADRIKYQVQTHNDPVARLDRSRPINGNRAKLSKFWLIRRMKESAAKGLRV